MTDKIDKDEYARCQERISAIRAACHRAMANGGRSSEGPLKSLIDEVLDASVSDKKWVSPEEYGRVHRACAAMRAALDQLRNGGKMDAPTFVDANNALLSDAGSKYVHVSIAKDMADALRRFLDEYVDDSVDDEGVARQAREALLAFKEYE
jgi:hypothetical protein